jgi:hypothetical protein
MDKARGAVEINEKGKNKRKMKEKKKTGGKTEIKKKR